MQSFPILEFDPSREAMIEPSKITDQQDVPEHCVICFFGDVLEHVVAKHKAKLIVDHHAEDGSHKIYEIEHNGKRLAFFHPGVGAPVSGALLEENIALGCKKFIGCGGAGVLAKDMAVGHLVVVNEALRDEGLSYHYLAPSRTVIANKEVTQTIINHLSEKNLPFIVGKTWTTDAFYRETPALVASRRSEGCLTVEMEAAAMMAVAEFRKVKFGQVLYCGDDLSGSDWDHRGWHTRTEIRENLFWLCADAVLDL